MQTTIRMRNAKAIPTCEEETQKKEQKTNNKKSHTKTHCFIRKGSPVKRRRMLTRRRTRNTNTIPTCEKDSIPTCEEEINKKKKKNQQTNRKALTRKRLAVGNETSCKTSRDRKSNSIPNWEEETRFRPAKKMKRQRKIRRTRRRCRNLKKHGSTKTLAV